MLSLADQRRMRMGDRRTPEQRAAEEAAWKEHQEWAHSVDRLVDVGKLTPQQKSLVWRHIKADCPEELEFLNDPTVRELLARGGRPCFTPELVRAALTKKVAS